MACLPALPLPSFSTRSASPRIISFAFGCEMLCEEPGVDFTLGLAMVLVLQLIL